ncbi:hypothetical protein [Brevibacillus sp. NL20B1]|nr:hypothetical protein [Brevibacillus sp. NL20B1]
MLTKWPLQGEHVSVIRSVLAQQGSTNCSLRIDLRGIAKAA